jgi:hypothetical protein
MSRKLSSVVAVLACLGLLAGGTLQARPLAAPAAAAPTGLFQEICRWVSSGVAPIAAKAGVEMDPNGNKTLTNPALRTHGAESSPGRTRTR